MIIWKSSSGVVGIVTFLCSDKGSPKDRAAEAAGGAMIGGSYLLQLIIPALMLLAGLWLLPQIFSQVNCQTKTTLPNFAQPSVLMISNK